MISCRTASFVLIQREQLRNEDGMSGVFLGLVSAVCWGTADFGARFATRTIGTWRTAFFMQLLSAVGLTALMLATGALAGTLRVPIAAAVLTVLSGLILYRAFEVGVLALVSPISASYAAFAVLLGILTGTRLSVQHGMGIVLALTGVALAATISGQQAVAARGAPTRGVTMAIGASIGFGFAFWIFGAHVAPVLGGIAPVWIVRVTAVPLLGLLALPARQSLTFPAPRAWVMVSGIAVLDTFGYIFNLLGLATRDTAIVNVMGSLFSTVTVILAWLFLRERLHGRQLAGLALIFAGIILVSG
jgi:drug/metabolite transporter (DMT)-like permease